MSAEAVECNGRSDEPTGRSVQLRTIRGIGAAAAGNVLEWYDWTIYATLALFFSNQFFPSSDPTTNLLNAFLVFALGFAARPLGGWLIGSYCDRRGRRAGLSLTIVLMGVGTLMIAVAPTYSAAGLIAPAFLVLARLVQGVSYGGEVGSASAYVVEIAPPRRRGLFSSLFHFSVGLGLLAGSAIVTVLTMVLTQAQMETFGWRIPFVLGGLVALVGLWMRRRVTETDYFEDLLTRGERVRRPLFTMITQHPAAAFKVAGLALAGTLSFYLFVTYLPTYAARELGITRSTAFLVNTIALALYTAVQPLVGLLADRWGRKPLALVFSIGTAVSVVPMMLLLDSSVWRLLVVQCVGVLLFAFLAAVTPVMMAEQFPTAVRTVGIGVPYALTVAIFGGTTPYLLTWFSAHGMAALFFWYVAAAAAVSTIAFLTMHDRTGRDLAA